MKWIKLSEKLPILNEDVLLTSINLKFNISIGYLNGGGSFDIYDNLLRTIEFTHWMPLPNPPEES